MQQFVGRRATMDNFISTAASEGAGFSEKEIILNIYVPEGTEMMYAEPFSNFGNGGELIGMVSRNKKVTAKNLKSFCNAELNIRLLISTKRTEESI